MSPLFPRRFRWMAIAGAFLLGCGGPSFDGHVYQSGDLVFRVSQVPPEWRRIPADGALLAFRDDTTRSSIAVNGRCGKDGDDVPLEALTHHLFLEFTDRVVEHQATVEMDGRAALETELVAKLDGVEQRFVVYVLKKNGCVYDFIHIAPPGVPAEARRPFVAFVEGFSTIKP